LAFTGGEVREAFLDRGANSAMFSLGILIAQGSSNGPQEQIVVERLFQKVHRAMLHGLNRERDVCMACDDDDGYGILKLTKPFEEIDAAHAGHPNIGHYASTMNLAQRV
jgi:hypothetical protein